MPRIIDSSIYMANPNSENLNVYLSIYICIGRDSTCEKIPRA